VTVWQTVLLGSVAVLALKVVGYLVPPALMERPTPARVANLTTVALLAALVVTQTFERGSDLVLDARVPAVVVSGILFTFRVPFIVVIVAAALIAAGLRLLGVMN
jgi:hypothetical protein